MANSKCTVELTKQVVDLILKGLRDIDICKAVGISQPQFYAWQREGDPSYQSAFSASVQSARAVLQESRLESAVHSLYQIATGYDAEESKTDFVTDKVTKSVVVKSKTTYKKHIAPNVQALQFLLSNIDADHWKHRQSAEITGKDGRDLLRSKEIDIDALTPEQKATLLSLGEEVLREKEINPE